MTSVVAEHDSFHAVNLWIKVTSVSDIKLTLFLVQWIMMMRTNRTDNDSLFRHSAALPSTEYAPQEGWFGEDLKASSVGSRCTAA